jgi:hypothetical protein
MDKTIAVAIERLVKHPRYEQVHPSHRQDVLAHDESQRLHVKATLVRDRGVPSDVARARTGAVGARSSKRALADTGSRDDPDAVNLRRRRQQRRAQTLMCIKVLGGSKRTLRYGRRRHRSRASRMPFRAAR